MIIASVRNGSQIASEPPQAAGDCAQSISKPTTLGELIRILESDPPKSLPMLRSTASKIVEFYNLGIEEITLDRILEMRDQFRRYLEKAPYTENSIRSYVNYLRVLLQEARNSGWRPYLSLSQEWQRILALASGSRCTDITRSLSLLRKSPRDVTPEDVDAWGENALERGIRIKGVRLKKYRFWQLLRKSGMTEYVPPSVIRAQSYRVPWNQLPNQLRVEVERLLNWKTADFQPGRPKKGQIRQVTADIIRDTICQLLGFAINIRGLSAIDSLSVLVRQELVSDYLAWCINERAVKGSTLYGHLGRLEVAMRQHPSFASLDLTWFKALLESLPTEPESERRIRKEKKYLDYSVVEAIPSKIRAERLSGSRKSTAQLAMEEFLIRWLLALPWRQRNIRECRIGGTRPNIFKERVPRGRAVDMPAWVKAEEQADPEAVFWQMRFGPKETKTGKEIRAFVPRPLIKPLEEYLAQGRPMLLKNVDPGTLFLTKDGTQMTRRNVYDVVTSITSRYGGRSVNPHLFRDIVAFAWLKEHPQDYLTLSKILWHANINVTIKTYGSRFDESSGVCAMEAWLEEREKGSK